jgi:hypothetical protein
MSRDLASLHAWMLDWAECIRAVDYAAARVMFSRPWSGLERARG